MKALTKESIFKLKDIKTVKVEIPEWGGFLWVKTMTGTERDSFEAGMIEQRGRNRNMNFQNMRARLVALVVVDKAGKHLFGKNDVIELGNKNAKALDRVFTVAQKLNGITPEDVEELTQELADSPFDSSASDSPSNLEKL